MRIDVNSILRTSQGVLLAGDRDASVCDFSIDSRVIKPYEAFIAIKGKRYDGHDFIIDAYKKGVRFFIIQKNSRIKAKLKDSVLIKVEDTRKTLAKIAHVVRRQVDIPVIAITGSCGKTTTKEMTASILESRFRVLKNIGTQNNEIGLPLTLLRLRKEHNIAILEMGMNHPGEITNLNRIALANIGAITCIYPVHLKYLKDIKNIAKAKWELIKTLRGKKRVAILNNDDDNLVRLSKGYKGRVVTFGIKNKSDFMATDIQVGKDQLIFKVNRKEKISLNLIGEFNIYNALCAIAVSRLFKISFDNIRESLSRFKPPPMRMNRIKLNGMLLINDGYNANPESMDLAIQTLSNLAQGRRSIVVCCDMLELGRFSKELHLKIGQKIALSGIDCLITMGKEAFFIYEGARRSGMDKSRIYYTKTAKEAASILKEICQPEDIILFKGSRSMKPEEIVKCFMSYFTH